MALGLYLEKDAITTVLWQIFLWKWKGEYVRNYEACLGIENESFLKP